MSTPNKPLGPFFEVDGDEPMTFGEVLLAIGLIVVVAVVVFHYAVLPFLNI